MNENKDVYLTYNGEILGLTNDEFEDYMVSQNREKFLEKILLLIENKNEGDIATDI